MPNDSSPLLHDLNAQREMCGAILARVRHDPESLGVWDARFVEEVNGRLNRRQRLRATELRILQTVHDHLWPQEGPLCEEVR